MSSETPQPAPAFTPPTVERIAQLLPAYTFEQLIAAGGMGAVYKATQDSLERPVAIKVLPPEFKDSEDFRLSFEKEAKLMAKVNHPNLIGVYDFGETEEMLYIVMEYVDGASLFEHVNNATLDPIEALEVIRDICLGLGNAHDAGILHRDIKPANIFITSNGTPKIGDFGLARPSSATESGIIFGTPGYAAPEVTSAPALVGPATDLFSVGVMLYELLTAKLPEGHYPSTSALNSNSAPEIDTLINKAIAPDLEQRYQTTHELVSDIENLLVTLRTKAAAAAKFKTPAVSHPQRSTAQTPARPVPPKKNSTLLSVCIIVVLVAAIFGTLEFKKRKEAAIASSKQPTASTAHASKSNIAPSPQGTTEDSSHLPPSAVPFGDRKYYLCDTPMNQEEAILLAQELEAQLASPSDSAELQFLQSLIQENIPSGSTCRLHSEINDNHLAWGSMEPWTKLDWEQHQPQYNDALVVLSGSSTHWETTDSSQKIPYTLFEWSDDQVRSSTSFTHSLKRLFKQYEGARAKLTQPKEIAAQSIQQLEKRRDSQLRKNSILLISEIRIYRKSLSKAQLESLSPYLDSLLSDVRESYRIPSSPENISAAPHKKIAATLINLSKSEQRILANHSEEIKKVSTLYKTQMKELISEFENNNLETIANQSKDLLEQVCKSTETFTQFIL